MRTHSVFFLVMGLSLLLAGCGDDDGPLNPDAGQLRDLCLGTTDMEIVYASRVDAGAGVDAGAPDPIIEAYDCTITPTCAELYFAEQLDEALVCVNECMDGKPSAGLSNDCRTCFSVEAVECAGNHCLLDCVGGMASACSACFQEHCQARLDICIGY